MNTLYVVSKSHFPSKDASAIRYENFFYAFKKIGFEKIIVFEYGFNAYNTIINHGLYDSICVRKQYKLPLFFSKLLSRIGMEKRFVSKVKNKVSEGDVIIVGGNFSLKNTRKIHSIAKLKNAKVILSITEKYSKCNFALNGLFSTEFRINRQIYARYKKDDPNVICISEAMKCEFEKKGVKTITVPFVFNKNSFDTYKKEVGVNQDNKIVFIYTGNPCKKDCLSLMLNSFSKLDKKTRDRIAIRIIGVDFSWAKKNVDSNVLSTIRNFASFEGICSRDYVINAYLNSHFSILLRPYKEDYSKYGFPTKISESLFLKTPPITNLTSDLSKYLVDGYNSIVVDGEDSDSFKAAIMRSISFVENGEYSKMSSNAYSTAVTNLEIDGFVSKFAELI